MEKMRIAIIGASTGQLPLCKKAREMGLETFCYAWPEGAVCKDYVDHFIPISIYDMDDIVADCRKNKIDGVVSNCSEKTAFVASYVAEKLGTDGVSYSVLEKIQNKEYVRSATNDLPILSPVKYKEGKYQDIISNFPLPFVIKPIIGAAKLGVNFVQTKDQIIDIPESLQNADFMVEQYIEGKEYSVESISFRNHHQVIQITEKISTGAPHFVELEHHQPALLTKELELKIKEVIPLILNKIGFNTGATHTEIKISPEGNIYLIEVNPRGGGDSISSELVCRSTDCDYLKEMILAALGLFKPVEVHHVAYSGIYFLSSYTARLLPYFEQKEYDWMVERKRHNDQLTKSTSNYDRDGYIIYCSNQKIEL